MNINQIRHNERLREKLASEYVLGTLRGGARRRFETWMQQDAGLRRAVVEWQERLSPMAEFAPPAKPSPQVWQAIEARLDLGRASSRRSFWLGLREDLAFWRGLGMTSTALAAVLVAVLYTRQPELAGPSYVATLADDKAQAAMVITGDARRHVMTVKVVTRQDIGTDKSLELWAISQDGKPRSLGLIAPNGTITLPLPETATPQSAPVLAITLEPKGGSGNPNAPTGPILYKGAWLQV
jgi:anti-sigma-K factor RskA